MRYGSHQDYWCNTDKSPVLFHKETQLDLHTTVRSLWHFNCVVVLYWPVQLFNSIITLSAFIIAWDMIWSMQLCCPLHLNTGIIVYWYYLHPKSPWWWPLYVLRLTLEQCLLPQQVLHSPRIQSSWNQTARHSSNLLILLAEINKGANNISQSVLIYNQISYQNSEKRFPDFTWFENKFWWPFFEAFCPQKIMTFYRRFS